MELERPAGAHEGRSARVVSGISYAQWVCR
jgi:hypothetical protein